MLKIFLLLVSPLAFCTVYAQEGLIPLRPEPAQFVNDYAALIPQDLEASLEAKLKNFDQQTSNQIAIVILQSLKGNDLEKLSNQWFKAWGIGQKEKNNGVLILVAKEDRKMRIEVGYGLESVITNEEAKKVIETFLQPNFREKDYYKGLDEATTYLMDLAAKKYNQLQNATASSSTSEHLPNAIQNTSDQEEARLMYVISFIVIIIIIASIFLWIRSSRNKKAPIAQKKSKTSTYKTSSYNSHHTNHSNNNYIYTNNDSSSSSSYNSSSSYDSSSSSDSGSSFGGGDSGGGGSSGDW